MRPAPLFGIALALEAIVPLSAQVQWTQREILERAVAPIAYDTARDRLVLFWSPAVNLAAETWEFDGTRWSRRTPATSPPPRSGHALVYDAKRARTVLFGGDGPRNDTWEWDGASWTQRTPATAPPARNRPALAYDAARGRTVLFGGFTQFLKFVTYFNDTWEWDGTNWTQVMPAVRPLGRASAALAFDGGARVLLFGGDNSSFSGGGLLNDTWEFDGASWIQRLPATSPIRRADAAITFDAAAQRVLLFGGRVAGGEIADAWEWNGSTWAATTPTTVTARSHAGLAYDTARGRALLFSGSAGPVVHGDLWQRVNGTWTRLLEAAAPPPRHSPAAAFDTSRGRLVVFGGYGSSVLGDHWELSGDVWAQITVAVRPSPRGRSAMAFDARRGRAVLFGGELPGPANDTWEWDGAAWTRMSPAVSPPARFEHELVFDAARGVTVLFGGISGPIIGDTWTYDGTTWTQRFPATAPSVRWGHALAFDAARGEVVLFGGSGPGLGLLFADTWVWDGASWTQRQPATAPPARADHAMTYDPTRGRVVLFGGGFGSANDAWEWDGSDWQQRATTSVPLARNRHVLAFDSARQTTLLFGGSTLGPNLADAWDYAPIVPARATAFGNGCAGSAGVPQLGAVPGSLPWAGVRFELRVQNLPPLQPAAIFFGLSSTTWAGGPLPLPLGAFGWPGCALLVSPDLTVPIAAIGGTTTLVLPALGPQHVGGTWYNQALSVDPASGPARVVFSNGVRSVVGAR